MDVSIIIVNYNTKELTVACIASVIEKTEGVDYEIILVDNASSDGTVDVVKKKFSNVIIRQMDDNVGFGRANNAGAELAKGKYLFLLNSDTILIENSIKVFFDFMEHNSQYTACGCNLIDGEGQNSICHGKLPTLKMEFFSCGLNKVFRSYYKNILWIGQNIHEGNISNTGYISGADVFIHSDVFNDFGGFDPHIFMYYEETDLFCRMHKLGKKFCILDNTKIIHYGGGSLKKITLSKFEMQEQSRLYYYRKNHGEFYAFFAKVARMLNTILHPTKLIHKEIGILVKI